MSIFLFNNIIICFGHIDFPDATQYTITFPMAYTNADSITVWDSLLTANVKNACYDCDLPSVYIDITTTYWTRSSHANAVRRWASIGY